jgi:hypothetical protein
MGTQAVSHCILGIERQGPLQRLPGGGNLPLQEMLLCGLRPVVGRLRVITARSIRRSADPIGIVKRPLHRIERIQQHGLARGRARLHIGLLIRRH